jgi:hypothetical protein
MFIIQHSKCAYYSYYAGKYSLFMVEFLKKGEDKIPAIGAGLGQIQGKIRGSN